MVLNTKNIKNMCYLVSLIFAFTYFAGQRCIECKKSKTICSCKKH